MLFGFLLMHKTPKAFSCCILLVVRLPFCVLLFVFIFTGLFVFCFAACLSFCRMFFALSLLFCYLYFFLQPVHLLFCCLLLFPSFMQLSVYLHFFQPYVYTMFCCLSFNISAFIFYSAIYLLHVCYQPIF